jgi:hypothetical protein
MRWSCKNIILYFTNENVFYGTIKLGLWLFHLADMGIDFYYIANVPMYSRWLLGGMIVSCCLPIVYAIRNAYLNRRHWSMVFLNILGLRHTCIDPNNTEAANFVKV